MKSLAFSNGILEKGMDSKMPGKHPLATKITTIRMSLSLILRCMFRMRSSHQTPNLLPLAENQQQSPLPLSKKEEWTQDSNMYLILSENEIKEALKSGIQKKFNLEIDSISTRKHDPEDPLARTYGAVSLAFRLVPKSVGITTEHPDETNRRMDPQL